MTTTGERFANAVAAQDRAALRGVLTDDVDFAALTPGRTWASTDAAEVADEIVLGRWFGAAVRIVELCSVTTGQVVDCEQVGYRLRVRREGTDNLVEQQAFYTTRGDRIDWIRIVCSGYRELVRTAQPASFGSAMG